VADQARVAAAIRAGVHLLVKEFNAHNAAKDVAHDSPGYVGMFHGMANTYRFFRRAHPHQQTGLALERLGAVGNFALPSRC